MRIAIVAVSIVAAIHLFLAYEEFVRRHDPDFYGQFGITVTQDQAQGVGRIISNAAAFNALLGLGLVVSLVVGRDRGLALTLYLLVAIIIAGIVGSITLDPKVIELQSAPAAGAALLVLWAARPARAGTAARQ